MGDGPFAGWLTWVGDPSEDMLGPFYFRSGDVTVTLNSEFVGAGVVGSTIYSTGRIVRDTKSLAFVHGQLEQDDKPICTFSSVMTKITPR